MVNSLADCVSHIVDRL